MNIKLDATKVSAAYSSAFQKLRALSGFDHRIVLRAEMGSILKAWAGETKVATEDSTRRHSRLSALKHLGLTSFRSGNNVTINSGTKHREAVGKIWFKTGGPFTRSGKSGKPFIDIGTVNIESGSVSTPGRDGPRHLKDADWGAVLSSVNAYRSEYPNALRAGIDSAGLARNSVCQIATALGIDLYRVAGGRISASGLAKGYAAVASNGRSYQNGTGSQGGDEVKSYIEAINNLPYNTKPSVGMDRSLLRVLNGRAKSIQQAYAKGAFDSAAKVAAQFPNLIRVAGDPGTPAAAA